MAASKLLDGIPKEELLDAFVKTVSMQDLKNHVKKMEKAKVKVSHTPSWMVPDVTKSWWPHTPLAPWCNGNRPTL